MVRSCSLKNCNNSVKQKYRFFLLPSVKKVAKRAAWLQKCGHLLPECLPTHGNSISLCEGHFEPDQFVEYGPNIRTILKPTAVPTIFIRNPPRVCDAIESLYEETINEENIGEQLCESDVSRGKSDEEKIEINTKLPKTDRDPTQFEQRVNDVHPRNEAKQHSEASVVNEKIQSPIVQLLQIRKNCMFVSSKQGTEVISTSSREILPDHKQPSQSDGKNNGYPNSFFRCNDRVKRVEKDRSISSPLSSSRNNRITRESKDRLILMQLSKPGRKLMRLQSPKQTKSFGTERVMINTCDNTNENIRHYTVSSTTNIDDGNIEVDKMYKMNEHSAIVSEIVGCDISSSSRSRDNSTSEYLTSSIKTEPLSPVNIDGSPLTYSRLSMNSRVQQKRVHDLEAERDDAMEKYRQLALRAETFKTNLRLFLNDDQIRLFESESPSLSTNSWSAETLQKSAKIRCIVGARAYEYLRSHEHYPLPSFRTLYRNRDISKINEYTDEMIQDHMNSTINEEAAMGAEDSEVSDVDIDEEHIKIEMLEPEYENSMECRDDANIGGGHEV